ncbi:MAG: hypothetical protein ACLRPT_04850 [Akkermansia muciniphila]
MMGGEESGVTDATDIILGRLVQASSVRHIRRLALSAPPTALNALPPRCPARFRARRGTDSPAGGGTASPTYVAGFSRS